MSTLTVAVALLCLPVVVAADSGMGCAVDQLRAASWLGKAELACWSGYVKNPQKDPRQSRLSACLAAAESKFVSSYEKALDRASRKAEPCSLNADAQTVVDDHLRQPLDALRAGVLDGWDPLDDGENKLLGSLLKEAGRFWSNRFAEEGNSLKNPDACRINVTVAGIEVNFEAKFQGWIERAAGWGVIYAGSTPDQIEDEIELLMAGFAPLTTVDGEFVGRSLWRSCQFPGDDGWHSFVGTMSHTDLTGGPFTFSYRVSVDGGACYETGQGSGTVAPDGSIVADYTYSGCNASGSADECVGCISATTLSIECSGQDLVGDTCSFTAFPHMTR
jgi:hypothetical protein